MTTTPASEVPKLGRDSAAAPHAEEQLDCLVTMECARAACRHAWWSHHACTCAGPSTQGQNGCAAGNARVRTGGWPRLRRVATHRVDPNACACERPRAARVRRACRHAWWSHRSARARAWGDPTPSGGARSRPRGPTWLRSACAMPAATRGGPRTRASVLIRLWWRKVRPHPGDSGGQRVAVQRSMCLRRSRGRPHAARRWCWTVCASSGTHGSVWWCVAAGSA